MDTDEAKLRALECADLSALLAGDLSPPHMEGASLLYGEPLYAALPWRRVAKAMKAVTSHRNPKPE
jgi:hypothetical protein